MTKLQAIKQNSWAFAWCMFAIWLTLLVSFENQASGIVIRIPQFRKDFGYLANGSYVLPAKQQAAFSGGPVASTAIGALTAGFFADLISRKKTVMAFLALSFGSVTMEFVSTTNELFFTRKVVNGSAPSWSLIDRIGRRNLTLWGVGLLTLILMLCGDVAAAGIVPSIKACIAFMIVYGFFYNMTISATAYTILTENATSRLKVKTIAIGVAVQNTWYTMWSLVLPYLFNPDKANLGAKIAFIFGGMSVLCFIYVFIYQPETAGWSYEELDELYMKRVPARSFKTFVTEAERQGQEASKKVQERSQEGIPRWETGSLI
ncbi:hypothetical protein DL95DRAFT_461259 [Leptodontidium sp. 2 PMI_412]|nr:hypothetical protein DL95DRAFT_461259 [Leptodontidium sp. 2 PMI_412]